MWENRGATYGQHGCVRVLFSVSPLMNALHKLGARGGAELVRLVGDDHARLGGRREGIPHGERNGV